MNIEVILYSIIIGAIGGGCVAAGAARMYHAPEMQGMGAFRTLGEMNACNGDPISHFSFGLGFFFNAAAAAIASGALTQDVFHRIVPNWSASVVMSRNKSTIDTLHSPAKMMVAGSFVGAIVVTFLNTASQLIPQDWSLIASNVLTPATGWLISIVMPIIFWIAAIDAGKKSGLWATILGGVASIVSGNALPGIVLGILIGKSAEQSGYKSKVVQALIAIVVIMFFMIALFRDFFTTLGF